MTKIDSYAQARISFYEARFQSETNDQLVNNLNSLTTSRGWTAERSYFTTALINELQRRSINLSAIIHRETHGEILSVTHCPVLYDKETQTLRPIN